MRRQITYYVGGGFILRSIVCLVLSLLKIWCSATWVTKINKELKSYKPTVGHKKVGEIIIIQSRRKHTKQCSNNIKIIGAP